MLLCTAVAVVQVHVRLSGDGNTMSLGANEIRIIRGNAVVVLLILCCRAYRHSAAVAAHVAPGTGKLYEHQKCKLHP